MKKSRLNKTKIEQMQNYSSNHHFNCLNAVMYALELTHELNWSWDDEIELLLNSSRNISKQLKKRKQKPKVGDVLYITGRDEDYMYCDDEKNHPIHFAIYIGNNKWFNKQGATDSKIQTLTQIMKDYRPYGAMDYQVRRIKKAV